MSQVSLAILECNLEQKENKNVCKNLCLLKILAWAKKSKISPSRGRGSGTGNGTGNGTGSGTGSGRERE